jgi:YD repeat-containing protein
MPWTETDADGTTTSYDDLGRLLGFVFSAGGVMSFSHDPGDRQTMSVLSLRGTVTRELLDSDLKPVATVASSFTYDEAGRVLTETRTTQTLTGTEIDAETGRFTYDADGKVLTLQETDSAGTTTASVTNSYDSLGQLTARITRTYDADGIQVQAVRTHDGTDPNGPLEKWRLAGTPWLPGAAGIRQPRPSRRVQP